MKQPSRLEAARRNVGIARYAIGIGAAVGLAAFAAAARVSHPGSSHASPARAATPASAEDADDDDGFFSDDDGSYAIGPSGSASPQIQSGGS